MILLLKYVIHRGHRLVARGSVMTPANATVLVRGLIWMTALVWFAAVCGTVVITLKRWERLAIGGIIGSISQRVTAGVRTESRTCVASMGIGNAAFV